MHRVGRTGRFGTRGLSVLLLLPQELPRAHRLLAPLAVRVHPLPLQMAEGEYLEPTTLAEPSASQATASGTPANSCVQTDDPLHALRLIRQSAKERKASATGGTRGPCVQSDAGANGDVDWQQRKSRPPRQPSSTHRSHGAHAHGAAQDTSAEKAAHNSHVVSVTPKGATRRRNESGGGEHASAAALEQARERGRQRGREQARQRARLKYGLPPDQTNATWCAEGTHAAVGDMPAAGMLMSTAPIAQPHATSNSIGEPYSLAVPASCEWWEGILR